MKKLQKHLSLQFFKYALFIILLMTPLFYMVTILQFGEEMLELEESVRLGKPIEKNDIMDDISEGLLYIYLLIFSALLFSIYAVQKFVSKKIMIPFYSTLDKIKRYSIEKEEGLCFETSNIEEFNELNKILDKFIISSRESYIKQRELIYNISHEHQTPLAILQIKIDKLADSEELSESLAQEIEQIYEVINKSRLMNQNLLLLAKVENNQFGINEEVYIVEVIDTNIIPNILLIYPEANIELKYDRDIKIKANSSLFTSVIKNLLVNAIRHSGGDKRVVVNLKGGCLQVINSSDLHVKISKEQLFDRFYKSSKSIGCGLGLSIVKSICDFHNWEIEYHGNDDKHIFEIKF